MKKIMLNVKPFQETLHADMCGPASLKIILDYYGPFKSERELAELIGITSGIGTDDKSIARDDFMKVWFDFSGEYIKADELIIR